MGRRKNSELDEEVEINNEDNLDFLTKIAKKTNGNILSNSSKIPYYISTGNLALNFICSGKFIKGGIPGGRIIEVYGPPATSKSLLGNCCLGAAQRIKGIAILLDCERAANEEFTEKAGHVNTKNLLVYEPLFIEEVEAKIISVTKAIREHYGKEKPILIVWDSIGVSPTKREWDETELPENPTKAQIKAAGGAERPGERAKACGNLLRKINPFINENNVTLFVINQTRNKIGVMYGSPETTAGGGEALKFYASTRLRTSVQKKIENSNGLPLGVNLSFENKKSRSSTPGLKTTGVQLFFEEGINPIGGLMSLLISLGRVKNVGKGKYKIAEEFSDGKDVTFNASISTRNDLPIDVILNNPKLIDASSKEEVQEFLDIFKGAISLAFDDKTVEKNASEDDKDDEDESDDLNTFDETELEELVN
jgi:recombination protein RecA